MNVVTAPAVTDGLPPRPWVFLAGGITNCPLWQTEAIRMLSGETGTLLNPRRENFPMLDKAAARQQIEWEFKWLNRADIFTMWFCAGPTDQPICFYELGRHLAISCLHRNEFGNHRPCVVGCEEGFKREQDVRIQTQLAMGLDFEIPGNFDSYILAVSNEIQAWHRNAYDVGE